MSGPNSVPAGDKALYKSLMETVCDKHAKIEQCDKAMAEVEKPWNLCVLISRREFLLKRGRLYTGKTR